ncbi:unnamed protein product [Lactuca virosa]|uniref:Uncharacterized protein n=1 Tax=Lactuca virosa TaxID=75947 RepID=A0AAU9M227_9ASTR|nr:unnamed protein product [Lactuca virosa]
MAFIEASEYKTKYEVAKKIQQEEHGRLVRQVSNVELKVANLRANDNELNGRLAPSRTDIGWMHQEGTSESFDKSICSETFVSNSKRIYKAYNDYGIVQGCRLMKE